MSRALAAPRPDRSALWFWLFVICAESAGGAPRHALAAVRHRLRRGHRRPGAAGHVLRHAPRHGDHRGRAGADGGRDPRAGVAGLPHPRGRRRHRDVGPGAGAPCGQRRHVHPGRAAPHHGALGRGAADAGVAPVDRRGRGAGAPVRQRPEADPAGPPQPALLHAGVLPPAVPAGPAPPAAVPEAAGRGPGARLPHRRLLRGARPGADAAVRGGGREPLPGARRGVPHRLHCSPWRSS